MDYKVIFARFLKLIERVVESLTLVKIKFCLNLYTRFISKTYKFSK